MTNDNKAITLLKEASEIIDRLRIQMLKQNMNEWEQKSYEAAILIYKAIDAISQPPKKANSADYRQ